MQLGWYGNGKQVVGTGWTVNQNIVAAHLYCAVSRTTMRTTNATRLIDGRWRP